MAKRGQAGFDCILKIGANEVEEAKNVTINMSVTEIEDSARDTEGWRSRFAGLGEWSVDFQVVKKYPESTALETLRTAFLAKTELTVTMTDKNGYGWTGEVSVIDFSEDQPYEDVLMINVTFSGRGAPTQVTPAS